MKKWISMMLALVLMAGMATSPLMAVAEVQLPKVGDTIHGFTVKEIGMERLIDAPKVIMEHDKTGAQVMYIAAEDVNCSFDISFRTPNLNSKGISHVFEHATISGSENYPSQNLFFPLATQTYNTFVNAMTYWNATTYPLSSLSDEQLLRIADYYLDGLFHPLIYTEERLYKREAWRYSLESADAPLTLTGTVYNEMRGNETIQSEAFYSLLDALYPDSIQSNVNGGDPDVIPEMTWQDLTDFHDTYYHPSNALVVLYGEMDYARFLELLAGYFDAFERREIDVPNGAVAPQTTFVERVVEFPVEAGSPAEDASIIQYAFVANGVELADTVDLAMLSSILMHQASPLSEAVRKALPGASFNVSSDATRPAPYICFEVEGVDAGDMPLFKQLVDESLAEMAEEGINYGIIDGIIAADEFSNLLITENSNLGINYSLQNMIMWAAWDSLDFYNVYLDRMDIIKAEAENGYFEALIERYLLGNEHAALVATVPAPGKAEEKTAALAASLAEIKAAMSEEEIAALVEETAALEAWSQEEAPKELIEKLQAVTASTLPEEIKLYDIVEAEIDGIETMTAQAAVGDIGSTSVSLDIAAVPQELLHYLNLYVGLMGEVDTEQHEREALQMLITRYLNGFSGSASMVRYMDKTYEPKLQLSWMSLMDEYETGVDLVNEILFHSKMDDLDIIQNVIGQQKVAMRNQINNLSYLIQVMRAGSARHGDSAYNDYLSGLTYYDFLRKAETMVADDPETLIASLKSVQQYIANRYNAEVMFASNEAGIETFKGTIAKLFDGIEATETEPAEYAFDMPAQREGIIVDSTVQFNLLYDSLEALGIEYTAKTQVLASLIYDAYIIPQVRHGIGAYDSIVSAGMDGITFVSYRDPSIKETYAVYDGLPEFAATAPVAQEDLDRYIVKAYSNYAMPQGELSGALSAMSYRYLGWPDEFRLERMREVKATTVEDLRALAPVFETLLEKGIRSTSGGAAMIRENAELFDNVITVQGVSETE